MNDVKTQGTDYLHDTFVVQGYSKLTTFLTKPLGSDHPGHSSWLTQYLLNSTLRFRPMPSARALAFVLLRRAEGAVADFDEACGGLAEFVATKTVSGYFRALRKFESAIAQLYQGLEFCRQASGERFFQKNDGTPYQRLSDVYNVGRHGNPETLPSGHVQLVWLENDGIHVASGALSFDELRDLMADLARAAEHISSYEPQS